MPRPRLPGTHAVQLGCMWHSPGCTAGTESSSWRPAASTAEQACSCCSCHTGCTPAQQIQPALHCSTQWTQAVQSICRMRPGFCAAAAASSASSPACRMTSTVGPATLPPALPMTAWPSLPLPAMPCHYHYCYRCHAAPGLHSCCTRSCRACCTCWHLCCSIQHHPAADLGTASSPPQHHS